MSLETASFIKDLVATNPQGTDPKSQGDDHLRLIKGVLQSQFPGFTDGVGITKTESQLNAMLAPNQGGWGGILFDAPAGNIDTPPVISRLFGIVPATTGTFPSGGVAGDVMLQMVYSTSHLVQLWAAKGTSALWYRRHNGTAWTAWGEVFARGALNTFAFGSGYSDSNSGRYTRRNGFTFTTGSVQKSSPVGPNETIATLPVGYRPEVPFGSSTVVAYANLATQMAQIVFNTDGTIKTGFVVTMGGTPSGVGTLYLQGIFPAVIP